MKPDRMRVFILGGGGMLGHKLWQVFSQRFDTFVTVRRNSSCYAHYGIFDMDRLKTGIDAMEFDSVTGALVEVRPNVVINCIGLVKQSPEAHDPIAALTINSLLPHRLAVVCRRFGARLIHISTDCVFSGRRGMYPEADEADPTDLYGRSKLLGEVQAEGCLTLRTSIIGRELETRLGLLEWLLGSRGETVKGYVNAIYTGFPTLTLAHILADIVAEHTELSGLYHVSSAPISKYHLLCILREAFRVPVKIEPFANYHCDRSLDSIRFRAATGFVPSSWPDMIQEMVKDATPYHGWRAKRAS